MAYAVELPEPAAVADDVETELQALWRREVQEQEAAEFIVRQVLERGATFYHR